jgi:hypothetical protein
MRGTPRPSPSEQPLTWHLIHCLCFGIRLPPKNVDLILRNTYRIQFFIPEGARFNVGVLGRDFGQATFLLSTPSYRTELKSHPPLF